MSNYQVGISFPGELVISKAIDLVIAVWGDLTDDQKKQIIDWMLEDIQKGRTAWDKFINAGD
jgi:hypothetical protein